jgi:hypothetical protein
MASRPAGVADKPASAPVPLAGGGADMFPLLPPEGSSGFMDFDLDLDLTAASSPASAPSPLPAAPSSLVEFDLFDPTVEDDIAPRSMRR